MRIKWGRPPGLRGSSRTRRSRNKIGGIDIHKKVLMVVVASVADEVADATGAARSLSAGGLEPGPVNASIWWLGCSSIRCGKTAQYWTPVWLDLEPHFEKLQLAQTQSNRAPKGRKNDFRDAKRLARRLLAGELMLSFVPEPEQRTWRLMTRGRLQLGASRCACRAR